MGWVVVVLIMLLIDMCLDFVAGKIIIGASVVAIGSLLIAWITGLGIFVNLAKTCAIIIVIVITGVVLLAIFGK